MFFLACYASSHITFLGHQTAEDAQMRPLSKNSRPFIPRETTKSQVPNSSVIARLVLSNRFLGIAGELYHSFPTCLQSKHGLPLLPDSLVLQTSVVVEYIENISTLVARTVWKTHHVQVWIWFSHAIRFTMISSKCHGCTIKREVVPQFPVEISTIRQVPNGIPC